MKNNQVIKEKKTPHMIQRVLIATFLLPFMGLFMWGIVCLGGLVPLFCLILSILFWDRVWANVGGFIILCPFIIWWEIIARPDKRFDEKRFMRLVGMNKMEDI